MTFGHHSELSNLLSTLANSMLFSTGYTATSLFDNWIITTNYLSGQLSRFVPWRGDPVALQCSVSPSVVILARVTHYNTCSESAHFTATHSRVEYLLTLQLTRVETAAALLQPCERLQRQCQHQSRIN